MSKKIEPGYQLSVTSWENDADYYKTIVTSGWTEEDIRFWAELAKHFYSCNAGHKEPKYGNMQIEDDVLVDLVIETLENHPNVSEKVDIYFKGVQNADHFCEAIQDVLLSYTSEDYHWGGDGAFMRVFSSAQVHYIPKPIEDVTKRFF